MQPGFHELLLAINDMKKSNDTRITQIKNNQISLGISMEGLENIQATMGTCMKNLKHNQENIGTCMKNMETNQTNLGVSLKNLEIQMGQLAQSWKENPSKCFSSDTEKNLKQCLVVTLRSKKELDEPKKIENDKEQANKKNIEIEEENGESENTQEGVKINNKEKKLKDDDFVPRRINFSNNHPVYTPPLPFP